MKILIVAATEDEIGPFLKHYNDAQQSFEILITGAGMIPTAFSLGEKLAGNVFGGMLNVGIAGSFIPEIQPGDLVRVKKETLSELGAEAGASFLTMEDLGLGRSVYHEQPFCSHLSEISRLKAVNGITVNKVHGDDKSIAQIIQQVQPHVESMEGAAVFYAGERRNIPCLQIRAISNYVEKRNKSNWQIEKAIKNLNHWLLSFTKSYEKQK